MNGRVGEVVGRADAVLVGLGHSPSTMWQYRWAWAEFESFCASESVSVVTEEIVDSFLRFVAGEYRQGRIKDWKRKLLRKAALVLAEVAATGSYRWRLSRQAGPNDGLEAELRLVQERYEAWLDGENLAVATRNLYATVSRTVLAWLPERGVVRVEALSPADISACVVFLGGRYSAGSMRTVLSAVRVWCRFLEQAGGRAGLSAAVPSMFVRRVISVAVLPADQVGELIDSPDPATPQGLRDRALLLLAARTGLRPVDIVGLRLGDIDWQHAQITLIQRKTGAVLVLPLLADVGDAIVSYLLHGRPDGVGDDHVFLRALAPFTGLAADSDLRHVIAAAFARTRIAVPEGAGRGLRVLRSSLATRMLEGGTPLPVIAGALGHRGTDSAKHYLAADEAHMRACCLDFTGIEPAGLRS